MPILRDSCRSERRAGWYLEGRSVWNRLSLCMTRAEWCLTGYTQSGDGYKC